MKTLQTILVLMFTVLCAGCSSSPLSNTAALSQMNGLNTKQDISIASTVGVANSASFEQIRAAAQQAGSALTSGIKKTVDPNSPEALHRDEMIARGEIDEETPAGPAQKEAASLHSANIDNCPATHIMTGMTVSSIPMGISECEMVSMRGKPSQVRRLSMPDEPRRLLLSFNTPRGQMMYEFVENRLTTIY